MILAPADPYVKMDYPMLDPRPISKLLGLKMVVNGTKNSFTSEDNDAKLCKVDIIEMEAAAENRVCYIHKVPFTCFKISN